MKIYFTLYLIPVVIAALLVFWLAMRNERLKLIFLTVVSVAVLAILNPAFAMIAVGLVLVAHQLVELKRRKMLSGGRVVLIIVAIAVITLGIGKYGQRGAIAIWGQDDWIVSHLLMPLGISYFAFRLLQYVFDCLRGVIEENSLLRLLAFVMFIPTFPAGPLETYQGFYRKRSYQFDRQLFYFGLRRITLGYFKKVFVVDFVFAIFFTKIIMTVGNPDFNFRSLRGNAVVRWEFHPGSTLFLVWTQSRSANAETGVGDFQLGRDLRGLVGAPPENIFLVKMSYWLGL